MLFAEKLLISPDPGLFHVINQGCLTVDGMDDQEECKAMDVSILYKGTFRIYVRGTTCSSVILYAQSGFQED